MKAFLKKRFSISTVLLFFIIIVLSMMLFRKAAIYLLLVAITAAFTYFNYHIRLPFDLSPVLFLSLIISREYNIWMSIIFIFLSGIFPMILAGGSFDHTTLFYLSIIIGVNVINANVKFISYMIAFSILIVLHHIIAFFGSLSFGNNQHKEIINLITKIAVDSFYLFGLGGFVMGVVG